MSGSANLRDMTTEAHQESFTVKATGTFTPPPPPCGNDACVWQEEPTGWVVIHSDDCEDN